MNRIKMALILLIAGTIQTAAQNNQEQKYLWTFDTKG
jgi:hypothetical protein